MSDKTPANEAETKTDTPPESAEAEAKAPTTSPATSPETAPADGDLPPGELPPVPMWAVLLGFGLWAGWLIFLTFAAFMVRG